MKLGLIKSTWVSVFYMIITNVNSTSIYNISAGCREASIPCRGDVLPLPLKDAAHVSVGQRICLLSMGISDHMKYYFSVIFVLTSIVHRVHLA